MQVNYQLKTTGAEYWINCTVTDEQGNNFTHTVLHSIPPEITLAKAILEELKVAYSMGFGVGFVSGKKKRKQKKGRK